MEEKELCSIILSIPIIKSYYAFDDTFAREVLGKKLSKGTKKDLDDVSAKTGILLKSCRRQFDNFKRVFKVVEELKGPLVENIRQHFLLPDQLARDYAAIVFFANNRFETGKKKLQYLTFQDFAFCAGQLINNWTVGAVDNMVEDMDVDLDKEFLQDLKDLKILITDKDLLDQHKSLVCVALRGKTKVFNEMEANFKFIEPCRSEKWTSTDVNLYLTHYTNSAHILDSFKCRYAANDLKQPLGRSKRGRPRRRFMDVVREDMQIQHQLLHARAFKHSRRTNVKTPHMKWDPIGTGTSLDGSGCLRVPHLLLQRSIIFMRWDVTGAGQTSGCLGMGREREAVERN
ncbi:acidic fibroblast growth factor intracellular-binding protein [Silurus meridionalis]|nr:acidic fibroblast growth factor intracellular-binding protein [Silurus meridionalis]